MSNVSRWVIVGGILFAISLLLRGQPFGGHLLFVMCLYAAMGGAWNLIGGYAGQLSLGHSIFFGLGAIVPAILFIRMGISPWLGMIIGAIASIIFSVTIGSILLWRLRSHFFALATMAVSQVMFLSVKYFKDLTGGSEGLPIPVKGGAWNFVFHGELPYIGVAILLLLIVTISSEVLKARKLGYQLIAGREDEDAAESLGISTLRTRIWTFALSACLVSLAGTLYVQYSMFADPDVLFGFNMSITMALMAVIGGIGTVPGPVIGAVILSPLDAIFRSWLGGKFAGFDILSNGIILIAAVLFFSKGIMEGLRRWTWSSRDAKTASLDNHGGERISQSRRNTLLSFIAPTSAPLGDTPILCAKSISKRFCGLEAMKNVSFSINRGELVGIIGPNGAGKTTLFNLITGFVLPDSGAIEAKGEMIDRNLSPHKRCLRHRISRTFQLARPFEGLTVLENVLIGAICRLDRIEDARERAKEVLEFSGLTKYSNTKMADLPVALKKRIEIARSLATVPEILLLDEPVSGLNPEEVEEAIEFIRSISEQGVTVIIIEHVMKAIMNLSERILVLDHGEKIAEGTPEEIANDPNIIRIYMGESA